LPTLTGGGHEGGLRAGTTNVPLVVGAAEAFRLAMVEREERLAHVTPLRDRLLRELPAALPGRWVVTGHPTDRLPHHASFALRGLSGNDLLMHLDLAGIAASSGSACASGDPKPSAILDALGLGAEWTKGGLRLTLGRQNTADVDAVLAALPDIVNRLAAVEERFALTHACPTAMDAFCPTPAPDAPTTLAKGERRRVVVAMSGGVDSSVAAALLADAGHEAIGIMMRLWSEPANGALSAGGPAVANRCCTPDQMADARRVADQLGIPFYVIDVRDHFRVNRQVLPGRARRRAYPNPCVECNRQIRHLPVERALALGQTPWRRALRRVRHDAGGYRLLRAWTLTRISPTCCTCWARPTWRKCCSRWGSTRSPRCANWPAPTACPSPPSTTARTYAF
jgi:hypothetical protein